VLRCFRNDSLIRRAASCLLFRDGRPGVDAGLELVSNMSSGVFGSAGQDGNEGDGGTADAESVSPERWSASLCPERRSASPERWSTSVSCVLGMIALTVLIALAVVDCTVFRASVVLCTSNGVDSLALAGVDAIDFPSSGCRDTACSSFDSMAFAEMGVGVSITSLSFVAFAEMGVGVSMTSLSFVALAEMGASEGEPGNDVEREGTGEGDFGAGVGGVDRGSERNGRTPLSLLNMSASCSSRASSDSSSKG